MSDLISLYRQMADDGTNFRGLSILQHRKQIAKLCREHQVRNLLDYGCGAGDAYRSPHKLHKEFGLRWFEVTLYDPAFIENADMPLGRFDGVLCSDVLEHVPEEDVDELIDALFHYARKFVWASVCCRQAKKTFPDGTNLHVTLRPIEWWRAAFERRAGEVPFVLVETP
jgi:SAM-dependent methyltransferase